ncbi:hypothetical protein M378DRAFT_166308 [Amanita muscaria Koide BX008]|uniref:Uncharacterized protein n=1 Tax=Amanita muscaria (strain Koide BX008) TaxID=946122 RepID=A0A0C2WK94_AMAMK|nr:hypothetical protein M378DRAFT_166308 [Amanita muscaria Koide BX008]
MGAATRPMLVLMHEAQAWEEKTVAVNTAGAAGEIARGLADIETKRGSHLRET